MCDQGQVRVLSFDQDYCFSDKDQVLIAERLKGRFQVDTHQDSQPSQRTADVQLALFCN